MNWTIVRYIALVAWCISATGCTICQLARRTVWQEPAAYSWKHDRRHSTETYLQWANTELAEEASRCPDLFGNPDYVMGFRDGFVDFVWAGGTGEPPPIPPRQFWNVMLRSPDGKTRANLWFDGYRHGAAVARDGGYRDLGTIRSSLVGFANAREEFSFPPMMDEMAAPDAPQAWQDGEMLPEPPAAAPLLPSPFESGDAPADNAAAGPAAESAPASTPAPEEAPFQDDPQPPPAETEYQPLSMDAAIRAQHVNPQHDATANVTSLQKPEAGEFGVQPAILLKEKHDDGDNLESDSSGNHSVSTVKFVEERRDNETESASSYRGEESQRQSQAATIAQRAFHRNSFRGWTRSGSAASASSSQLRVLDE
jgi:hypothetical protein